MKKHGVLRKLLVAVLMMALFMPNIPAKATDASGNLTSGEMKTARRVEVNDTTEYQLADNQYNLDNSGKSREYNFMFRVPRAVFMTFEIRVGAKETTDFDYAKITIYDKDGSRIETITDRAKYDKTTKESVFKISKDNKFTAEGYIGIKLVGLKKDSYIKIKLTPRIPGTEKINEIKKAGASSILIRWSKTTAANGYVIYRATSKTGTYAKVATVKTNTVKYTLKNVPKNKKYFYKVKAYRYINGKMYYSDNSVSKAFTLK